MGINHVGLSVSDLKASMILYNDALGLGAEDTNRFSNAAAEKASGFGSVCGQ
jgi:catechol 2,3-dioxygenase-like lactoylglutathione lyase family enzyme